MYKRVLCGLPLTKINSLTGAPDACPETVGGNLFPSSFIPIYMCVYIYIYF